MNTLMAALPLLASCAAILVAGQTALRAGMTGLLLTFLIIVLWPPFSLSVDAMSSAVGSGLFNTYNVAYVLLGGVAFYQTLKHGRALDTIAETISANLPDRVHSLFALVFGLSVFFESATGFGVGVVVVAPLFIALGYTPVQSAVLALLGQCAVPWGALAIGTVVGADLSGVTEARLGELSALISLPFLILCGLAALSVSRLISASAIVWLFIYAALLAFLLWLFSGTTGIELTGCLAGLCILGVALALSRTQTTTTHPGHTSHTTDRPSLFASTLPFAVLLATLLITRLNPTVREWLENATVTIGSNKTALFYHAGFWLIVATLCALLSLPNARRFLSTVIPSSFKQWSNATLAVGGFLIFGQLMSESGMSLTLAAFCVDIAGPHYAVMVPVLGGLGGFLTASNASSNALFMDFQLNAAKQAGLAVDTIAALQNASGSNTTLASPGRVVFAGSVVGTTGSEALLLRRVLPVAVAGVVSTMVIALLIA